MGKIKFHHIFGNKMPMLVNLKTCVPHKWWNVVPSTHVECYVINFWFFEGNVLLTFMNGNYKSGNSCYRKEFIPHLCCLRVCIWFILDIRIHFIRHHRARKCGEIYVLLNNPTRCATHGLITPHHCWTLHSKPIMDYQCWEKSRFWKRPKKERCD
jgi:hypothetical protein